MEPLSTQTTALLEQLTLEEKIDLTIGRDAWSVGGIARLGIPRIALHDGPHGLRKPLDSATQN